MQITDIETHLITAYEFNNRNHSDEQINRIACSIKEFGFNQPIVIDENNIVLVGHGRLYAAKSLNLDKVPSYKITGLTEVQKKAYRILDNKLQNDSTWQFDNLHLELGFLEDNGLDLEEWGLDSLRDLLDSNTNAEIVEDDGGGELPDETYLKLGDLIELGNHRVLCGDSTTENNQIGDFVVTDPPYELDANQVIAAIGECNHLLLMTSIKQGFEVYKNVNLSFCFDLVWNQHVPSSMLNKKVPYYVHKNIFYFNNKDTIFDCDNAKGSFSEKGYYPSIIDAPKNTQEKHGLTKNLKAFTQMLSGFKFSTVYDPFLGSGTTLIAADQLNRTCYGMELEPKYCQVILERYQKHCIATNKEFICKINGEVFNGTETT